MSSPFCIAAIVLAAGQSRRMGSINKLLMEIDGVPMVRRVVDAIRDAGVGGLWVVTGYERGRVETCLRDTGAEFVFNDAYESGMGTSLAIGAKSLQYERFDGILVCLGDLPYLDTQSVKRVIGAFREWGGQKIAIPSNRGKRGHPIVFPVRYRSALEGLQGDVGARDLIVAEKGHVVELEIPDEGVVRDVDSL